MELAQTGLFHARWTNQIHEEWIENLLLKEPNRVRSKLERTRDLMNSAVLDCLITGFEARIESLDLPDLNDRHVLAAAIHGKVDVIVTFNLSDYPGSILSIYGMEAQHPDAFVDGLIQADPDAIFAAVKRQRERLKNPPRSVEEFLATLERQSLPKTVSQLRTGIDRI
jgi:hypothetical protein